MTREVSCSVGRGEVGGRIIEALSELRGKTGTARITPRHELGGIRLEVGGEAVRVPPLFAELVAAPPPTALSACCVLRRLPLRCWMSRGAPPESPIRPRWAQEGPDVQGCLPYRGALTEAKSEAMEMRGRH
ncbi:hypothetical protein NDU88_009108 [Pleurodeles waltl]|uniref:Uncharacterized protein n=1 Tax=Pleurodeles waltl TaxID=8319 RepID=A0AAV7QUD5_PLEWA|nr:hypothetical protein NDU88_009108 [Pleurodeles waltl]